MSEIMELLAKLGLTSGGIGLLFLLLSIVTEWQRKRVKDIGAGFAVAGCMQLVATGIWRLWVTV